MRTHSTRIFCKQLTCPSSETLLSYAEATGLTSELKTRVTAHLAGCDFCGAELQLLSREAPLEAARCENAKMPAPLRYLAESLLAGSLLRIESFSDAIYDKERLTYTDA